MTKTSSNDHSVNIKKKLASLKRTRRFVEWRDMRAFARSLDELVVEIDQCIDDPWGRVSLLAGFIETDKSVFHRCDDSNGSVGDVYHEAIGLFINSAKQYQDKKAITKLLLKLNKEDDFGIRSELINVALECGLDEAMLRFMVDEFKKRAEQLTGEFEQAHQYMLVEMLARQLGDAYLFEQACLAKWGELPVVSHIKIAEIHFNNGDLEDACDYLNSIKSSESFMARERDDLWLKIYRAQEDTESVVKILSKKFHQARSVITFKTLLDEVGEDKREKILDDAVTQINEDETFNSGDTQFLITVGRVNEAEAYLFKHADQIDGHFYGGLLSLINLFEEQSCYLAMSLLYRRLLLSILERAFNKAYNSAAGHLKKLDKLEKRVADWQGFETHQDFKKNLIKKHGKKRSFWGKYEGHKK